MAANKGKKLVIVESPTKQKTISKNDNISHSYYIPYNTIF